MRAPARAQLGRRYAGQPIGYRVLTLDGAPYAPFSRDGVRESQPGHYVAAVNGPPSGGWIVWGTAGNPSIAEAELPAQPPTVDLAPLQEAIDGLAVRLIESIPKPEAIDLAPLERKLAELSSEQAALSESDRERRAADLDAIRQEIATTAEKMAALEKLNEAAYEFEHLDKAAKYFAELSHLGERLTSAGFGLVDFSMLTSELSTLRVQLEHLVEANTDARSRERAVDRMLTEIESFAATLEGGTGGEPGRFH